MISRLVVFVVLGAAVVVVHKLGHYAVGRWLVGISPEYIRLELLSLPQYVALSDGSRWVSPLTFEAYLEAYHTQENDPESTHLSAFLAAGLLAQTVCVVLIGGLALAVDRPFIGQSVVLSSGMLAAFHLFSDLGSTLHVGSASGDFSALFEQSAVQTVVLLVVFIITHGLLYAQF